jgi:hypothetical protein
MPKSRVHALLEVCGTRGDLCNDRGRKIIITRAMFGGRRIGRATAVDQHYIATCTSAVRSVRLGPSAP